MEHESTVAVTKTRVWSRVLLYCCCTAAVAVTVAARLLVKSRGNKCRFVSPCPLRSVLPTHLKLCVHPHRKRFTHTHAQTDAPSVAITIGRTWCATVVVPWLPNVESLRAWETVRYWRPHTYSRSNTQQRKKNKLECGVPAHICTDEARTPPQTRCT